VNGTLTVQHTHECTENGVIVDPTETSGEHGEACLDNAVELIEHVTDTDRDYGALEDFSPSRE
jgi:creatinine amidohydrolase/Fe(II)-dependent formamide hydrolase-like protein